MGDSGVVQGNPHTGRRRQSIPGWSEVTLHTRRSRWGIREWAEGTPHPSRRGQGFQDDARCLLILAGVGGGSQGGLRYSLHQQEEVEDSRVSSIHIQRSAHKRNI